MTTKNIHRHGRRARRGEVWMQVRDHTQLANMCAMRGITRRDFAEACGWSSPSYPHRILTGKARTVTPDAAARIAGYLEVPMDLLFVPHIATVSEQTAGRVAA